MPRGLITVLARLRVEFVNVSIFRILCICLKIRSYRRYVKINKLGIETIKKIQVENIDERALDSEIEDLKRELKNAAFLLDEAKEELTLADSTIAVLEEVCATDFQPLPDLVPGRN